MKPFRFTLEPVRVLRERKEREAMERYGQALMEVNRCKKAIADIDHQMLCLQKEFQSQLLKGALSDQIVHQQIFVAHLQECRKKAVAELNESEEKAKQAMQEMMLARQDREIIDKFREKQRAAYDHVINLEEQKLLDELAGRQKDSALSWKTQG